MHDVPILDDAQLHELTGSLQNECVDVKSLARELIKRRWLTAYQAAQFLRGA